MLVLTRKVGEKLRVGDDVVITVVEVRGNRVRIAVEAPAGVRILREELCEPTVVVPAQPFCRARC